MNWKTTGVLATLLGVAMAAYLLRHHPGDPGEGRGGADGVGPRKNRLFPDILSERVAKIDILRKGETVTTIDRATDTVGDYWRLAPPIDKPAEPPVVQQMLASLDRFVTTGGMDPGGPETAAGVTGLDDPRLVVTYHGPAGAKGTVRFGKSPLTNTAAVFFQKVGDPKIYLAAQEVFDALDKTAIGIRQKLLARYAPHQAVKVAVEKRFDRIRQGQPRTVEIETSVMERVMEGPDRGWWLTSPYRERVDDLKVQRLVFDLSALAIEDWRPAGDLREQGLEAPDEKVSIWLFGQETPVVVRLGALTGVNKRFAHVEGSGEVARVDARIVEKLPLQRSHFRMDVVFPFSRETVKRLTVDARGVGKVILERREKKNPETGLVTSDWEVIEPAGIRVDKDRLETFAGVPLSLRIADFLGAQDPKTARLDPAAVTVKIETYSDQTHVIHLTDQFMRREGLNEVFEVQPAEMAQVLRRLDLNFLNKEIFNVPRDSIRGFTFESRAGLVYYSAHFDGKAGKWFFDRPDELRGKEPDPNLMTAILNVMNYVQAEELLSRDPAKSAELKLEERTAPSTLTVVHDGGKAVFYISADQSDKPTRPLYYARMEGSSVVFQIPGVFIESLRRLQKKE
jgi:hypothetical protein